ncbi:hypothetical protein Pint_29615 [Pistacia integerrima]|uniref:Uncharacterized protein n=1 Tax=Pistacia integerrima TaxID=434235 RepID=A0ACC0X186_9ROSI|nr:hypothetical protein Pint_29615 [Pistacia integerrima]
MERNQQLRRQLAAMRQSLFDQLNLACSSACYMDTLMNKFIQLEELQDDANPSFVEEVVTLYYRDSARLISNIDQALEKNPLDFNKLDGHMHQFKGSSSRSRRTFQQLKKEYATLKKKLEAYFQVAELNPLARQAGPMEIASSRK